MTGCKVGLRRAALLLFTMLLAFPALADITGRARIVDGDTIEIRHQRIRLFGIDAPEARQFCTFDAKPWRCGQQATFALAEFIGKAWVHCETVQQSGAASGDREGYTGITAVCYLGRKNVNAWLVRNGWALDHGSKGTYSAEQIHAKRQRLGIWRGAFEMPWTWRPKPRRR